MKTAVRSLILPHPSPRKRGQKDGPIVVAGMFRTSNGIGRAAQTCYNALREDGLSPIAVDLSGPFNQIEHDSTLALGSMPEGKSGTLLLFANAPETHRALMHLGLRFWHDWRIVGCWAWELPVFPESWADSMKHFSEIWVPSRFVADALPRAGSQPIRIVPHHVPAPASPATRERGNAPFRFLCMADGKSSFYRKNISAAVRMFREAFEPGKAVQLTVKCRNLEMFPQFAQDLHEAAALDPRIELIEHNMNESEVHTLLSSCDVLVSPHRSEGFGLVMAEAMALGRPVIATGWSGNLDYMTEQNACLLPYRLVPVDDPTGIYQMARGAVWAEADIAAGVRAMRLLRDNPEHYAALGDKARQDVLKNLDRGAYTRALNGYDASTAPEPASS